MEMTLAAHSARILSTEGSRRPQKCYEAEWGFLPAYNDISPDGAKYVEAEGLHCRAGVIRLGGSSQNRLEWRDIHVGRGGMHNVRLGYSSAKECEVYVESCGVRCNVHLSPAEKGIVDIRLPMNKGHNTIIVGNDTEMIPATIDCISL